MTVAEPAPRAPEVPEVPCLAEGVELLGPYKDAGYADEHYLLARSDGRILLVSGVVYAVAELIDGQRDLTALAGSVGERLGRHLEIGHLRLLIDQKLRPLGVVAPGGAAPGAGAADAAPSAPLLSLGLRLTLLPAGVVRALSVVLGPLFHPLVVVPVLGLLVGADVWFFRRPGLTAALVAVLTRPRELAIALGLLLVAMLTHEIGHATACRYGGGRPGRIGVGVYLFFPAFFTNVTDTYRLGRWARVRTDLGGVYFNAIYVVVGCFLLAGHPSAVLTTVILILQIGACQQLLPLVRLDGYFVLSDLVGVPDLFSQVWAWLARRKAAGLRPSALRRGARAMLLAWVIVVLPTLAALLALLVLRFPLLVRVSWQVATLEWASIVAAGEAHHVPGVVVGLLSLMLVALPFVGMGLLALRGATSVARKAHRVLLPSGEHRRR